MHVSLPRNETYHSFVEVLSDQLTGKEKARLLKESSETGLKDLFFLWTLKEAYTKALGLGLGFEFSRIEYDFDSEQLLIDGKQPKGWKLSLFSLDCRGEEYKCAIAMHTDDDSRTEISFKPPHTVHSELTSVVEYLERHVHSHVEGI